MAVMLARLPNSPTRERGFDGSEDAIEGGARDALIAKRLELALDSLDVIPRAWVRATRHRQVRELRTQLDELLQHQGSTLLDSKPKAREAIVEAADAVIRGSLDRYGTWATGRGLVALGASLGVNFALMTAGHVAGHQIAWPAELVFTSFASVLAVGFGLALATTWQRIFSGVSRWVSKSAGANPRNTIFSARMAKTSLDRASYWTNPAWDGRNINNEALIVLNQYCMLALNCPDHDAACQVIARGLLTHCEKFPEIAQLEEDYVLALRSVLLPKFGGEDARARIEAVLEKEAPPRELDLAKLKRLLEHILGDAESDCRADV